MWTFQVIVSLPSLENLNILPAKQQFCKESHLLLNFFIDKHCFIMQTGIMKKKLLFLLKSTLGAENTNFNFPKATKETNIWWANSHLSFQCGRVNKIMAKTSSAFSMSAKKLLIYIIFNNVHSFRLQDWAVFSFSN